MAGVYTFGSAVGGHGVSAGHQEEGVGREGSRGRVYVLGKFESGECMGLALNSSDFCFNHTFRSMVGRLSDIPPILPQSPPPHKPTCIIHALLPSIHLLEQRLILHNVTNPSRVNPVDLSHLAGLLGPLRRPPPLAQRVLH